MEHAAADRAEPGPRLELDGVAKVRVVQAREPDPDRPLALGLGFGRLIIELAGDALGVDVADQRIADRARHARRGGRLAADLLQDDVDAALAVVVGHRAVARGIARHGDEEHAGQWIERAALLVLWYHRLGRRLPFRIEFFRERSPRTILR